MHKGNGSLRLNRAAALIILFIVAGMIVGCGPFFLPLAPTLHSADPQPDNGPTIEMSQTPLRPDSGCFGTFIPRNLDHITNINGRVIALYESNGSGVGINDLDNDGDLDIVLANLDFPSSILWNEGNLRFRTQRLGEGNSRDVSIVDVDGDGWLDIVFTQRFDKPLLWRNLGTPGTTGTPATAETDWPFQSMALPEVNNPFFTLAWADLDVDGDLDLVAASYDTELRKKQGAIFDYQGGGVGVFVYERAEGTYIAHRLSEASDALTIALLDLNGDDRLDILVGNDFDRADQAWVQHDDGWEAVIPFNSSTQNTMSFDVGDLNNDGTPELFATDMKPYNDDPETQAQWAPLMGMMDHPVEEGDPQILENVLQMRNAAGHFQNEATTVGLSATGWSWSSKFGDLDNDGFLDIYVVNGMIADGLLDHLPNQELVEENQALRNDGSGHFSPMPAWALGSTASGRGMSMADLDGDGDLDIVVNNLRAPAQLFENQLCGGRSIAVDLRWSGSQNPFALGSQLALHTSAGTYYRTIKATSGYLSGDPTRVAFGLPSDAQIDRLEIRWPDGERSTVEGIEEQMLVFVRREE